MTRSSASETFEAALRLLAVRDRSSEELAVRLTRKGFSEPEIDTALRRCRQLGYLDDARFALERARGLMRRGQGVGRKVLADLRSRGIPEATARAALEEADAEFDTERLLRDLLERRFPGFCHAKADERQRRRVIQFLQRRGFALDHIMIVIKDER